MKLPFILITIIISCQSPKKLDLNGCGSVSFNEAITENFSFQSLYSSPQTIFTFTNGSARDTCGVACINENARGDSFNPPVYYRCHAIIDADTLFIDIGSNSLWSGTGFTIEYANNKSVTRPYSWVHNNSGIPFRNDTIINQQLTLQKSTYITGDSVFGKISFDIIGDYQGKKKEYHRQGLFRGKVKQPHHLEVNGEKVVMDDHMH